MNIQQWTNCLWEFVQNTLAPNQPFYLCIDNVALLEIAMAEGHTFGSATHAEESFLSVCNECLLSTSAGVVLDLKIFETQSNGFSFAICFAVQQVLAVERMINDDLGSRDSYYVRYRQTLGLEPRGAASPLPYWQLSAIWNMLRKELLSLPNAGDRTITFSQGTGKNKYRALPMSQALLDQESLRIVNEHITDKQEKADVNLIHSVRQISSLFPKRARDKVYVDSLVPALLNQIRASSPAAFVPKPNQRAAEIANYSINASAFFVYIDDDGWDYLYRLGLRDGWKSPDEGYDLDKHLEAYFAQHEILPFGPGAVSDFDGLPDTEMSLRESMLLVLKEPVANKAHVWTRYFKDLQSYVAPKGYKMLIRDESVKLDQDQRPVSPMSQVIMFEGGLVVDRLRNTYICGFPPDAILLNGDRVSNSMQITVNGEATTVSGFLKRLRKTTEAVDCRVTLECSEIYIRLIKTRNIDTVELGYPIRGAYCSPITYETSDQGAVRYLGVPKTIDSINRPRKCLTRAELIKHLTVSDIRWVLAESDPIEEVISAVRLTFGSSAISRVLVNKILRRNSLPVTLVMAAHYRGRGST